MTRRTKGEAWALANAIGGPAAFRELFTCEDIPFTIDISMLRRVLEMERERCKHFIQEESITEEMIETLRKNRDIDMDRVRELTPEQLEDPMIWCVKDDPTHELGYMTIPLDGTHRLIGRHLAGLKTVSMYMLPYRAIELAKFEPVPGTVNLDVPWGTFDIVNGKRIERK